MSDKSIQSKIPCVLFQYARLSHSKCEGCETKILKNKLRVKLDTGSRFYHFECFWKNETTAKNKKDEILISAVHLKCHENSKYIKIYPDGHHYVSLEILDQKLDGILPIINEEDVARIREQVALAEEGKTLYYVPTIVKCSMVFRSKCCTKPHTNYYLRYLSNLYHPECLASSGMVNIDANDLQGYDILEEDDKKFLDDLFKKTDKTILLAHVKPYPELCSSKECINIPQSSLQRYIEPKRGIRIGELRIQYEHLTYHPQCFAAMGKININSKNIPNYDKLTTIDKKILDSCFIRSNKFNTPISEKAIKNGYCCATECLLFGTSTKFPEQYSILKDQEQVRFHGHVYHSICFQSFGNHHDYQNNHEVEDIDQSDLSNDDEPVSKKKKKLSKNEETKDSELEIKKESEENNKDGNYMNNTVMAFKRNIPIKQEIQESNISNM